jgi:hypothetical protein
VAAVGDCRYSANGPVARPEGNLGAISRLLLSGGSVSESNRPIRQDGSTGFEVLGEHRPACTSALTLGALLGAVNVGAADAAKSHQAAMRSGWVGLADGDVVFVIKTLRKIFPL